MPCFGPLAAYKPASGPISFRAIAGASPIEIACGQCIGCRLERSRQWAMRCLHESQCHEWSSFVTLTYDDDHLPDNYSLRYSDFQLFMKRLRARYSLRQRIRFFMCGEYGEVTQRPHYHACLFGVHFDDREFLKRMKSGCNIYTSDLLSELWPAGHSSIGDVTFESAAYVARYVVKKVTGAAAAAHYRVVDSDGVVHFRTPEFTHMSLKPGIGAPWYAKFASDVYPRDEVVIRGMAMKPPKYYDNLLEKFDPDTREWLDAERYKKSLRCADDATPARLRVREKDARARLSFKRRTLE